MIIIGGLGSIPGSVFGAIFITVLNEVLSGATEFFMNIGSLSKVALQIAPLLSSSLDWPLCSSSFLNPKGWQRCGASSGPVLGYGHFLINPPHPPFSKVGTTRGRGGKGGMLVNLLREEYNM